MVQSKRNGTDSRRGEGAFSQWEIRVAHFPQGKPAATESSYHCNFSTEIIKYSYLILLLLLFTIINIIIINSCLLLLLVYYYYYYYYYY